MRIAAIVAALGVFTSSFAQLPPDLPHLPEHHLEARLLALTNAARAAVGAPPVAFDPTLAQAARQHADEMVRLGYFSHVSPTPGRAAPEDRVRRVGGTLATLGANLALVSARDLDVARRIVDGWLDSPGHRTTLERPGWTHVGFGLAEDANGRLHAVQLFGDDPNPLRHVDARTTGARTLTLRVEVAVRTAGYVALGASDAGAVPRPAAAGATTTLTLDGVDADAATHVRLGWSPDDASAFIGQTSGWFDPATGRWSEDWTNPDAHVEVLRYAAGASAPAVALRLTFERDPRDLIVLVDGVRPPPAVNGASLEVQLPGGDGVREVIVGMATPDGRVRVVHAFEVVADGTDRRLR